jgi:hypothetical protein
VFYCKICGKRHYKGSAPALWCHSTANPAYIKYLGKMHRGGFHAEGTGGHPDCLLCNTPVKPKQLAFFDDPIRVIDICGCQG